MKKLICLVLMTVTLAAMLCGCGKFTCDLCGEEKSGRQYTAELFGMEITYCSDCKADLEELADLFG